MVKKTDIGRVSLKIGTFCSVNFFQPGEGFLKRDFTIQQFNYTEYNELSHETVGIRSTSINSLVEVTFI